MPFLGKMSGSARAKAPTYERYITGPVERFDERDNVFARADLFRYFGEGSEERRRYYAEHPELRAYDERTAGLPGLGRFAGAHEWAYAIPFEFCRDIASERFVDGEPSDTRAEVTPEEAARLVRRRGRELGADLVGAGPLKESWVYSRVGRSFGNAPGFEPWGKPVDLSRHQHAVTMAFRMDHDLTRAAPEFPTVVATALAYAASAWVAVRLASYIRSLGYSARAHHVYNYRVLVVPVAVDCGLGELSRAGFLLTREFGLGQRLSVVTTELPLAHDEPIDIGVRSFCERCLICAENCPSGAIPLGDRTEHIGVMKWKLDAEKCYRYWHAVGTDCAICMSTCPWTRPHTWLHRAMSRLAAVSGPHQTLMVWGAKLLYGGARRPASRRAPGMESLRPTRLDAHMRAMGVALCALLALAVWAAVDVARTGTISLGGAIPPGAAIQLGAASDALWWTWAGWTLLGVAVAWTFAAEREPRASLLSALFFGVLSALGVLALFAVAS
ncbi:MAG: 4Fe-4S dicluster domain-containing protein [Candidatus Eisenbacteria bacterium]|nr:4Fe-4S dicluster domain-containing protein [Candidatus Eisenbacteria bacterium]